MDSPLVFDIEVTDSLQPVDILFIVRNTADYPYQNLWLFIQETHNNIPIYKDTIECMITNNRGQWLGRGLSVFEIPLLYREAYQFPATGIFRYEITQGMRTECLPGIKQFGVELDKHGKE